MCCIILAVACMIASAMSTNTKDPNDIHGQTLYYFDSSALIFGLLMHKECYISAVNPAEAPGLSDQTTLDLYEVRIIQLASSHTHPKLTFAQVVGKSTDVAQLCLAATDFYDVDQNLNITATTQQPTVLTTSTPGLPRDCSDLFKSGTTTSGLYPVFPSGYNPSVDVKCDMTTDGGGWTVIQRRFEGSVNFLQNWHYYKNGFGTVVAEHWLGNEVIHQITSHRQNRLRINMEDFELSTGVAEYDSFRVDSEATKYTVHVTGFHGNRGDAFSSQDGMKFSTTDEDNDGEQFQNCVSVAQGCWWYKDCHAVNLNGQYNNVANGNPTNVHWSTWYTFVDYIRLQTTEMKIRPFDY